MRRCLSVLCQSEGQVLKEAMYINKSLTFLEQAILALADRKRDHVPFRQSKLTHVLKDSLGMLTLDSLICDPYIICNSHFTICWMSNHLQKLLSTLRFATRMKCIRTDPAVNEHYDPVNNRSQVPYEALSESQIAEINKQVRKYLEGAIDEIEVSSTAISSSQLCAFQRRHENCLVKNRKDETGSLPAGKDLESISPSKISYQLPSTKDAEAREQEVKSMVSHRPDSTGKEEPSLPSSPPSKVDAFEDFKLDSGSEINRIFEQNKAILLEKRRNVRQLVEGINIFKKEIDNTKLALQVKEQEREQQGQYINEEGDTIIDEEEFQLILKLKDLKASYRTHYDQLFSLRTEVQYCQHLVDQCRIRLLSVLRKVLYKCNELLSLYIIFIWILTFMAVERQLKHRHCIKNLLQAYSTEDCSTPVTPQNTDIQTKLIVVL
uniref:Kinesin family member 9 n=1 Tax=Erpetoichthys calabaricus TaxID=27687 RepID=A0A8C4SGG4_ERPCA